MLLLEMYLYIVVVGINNSFEVYVYGVGFYGVFFWYDFKNDIFFDK